MAGEPGRRGWSIGRLEAAERARLDQVGHWAVLTVPGPTPVSIPEVFAARVAAAPGAVAITEGDRSWTYREVDEAATRLARVLIGEGAGPGSCVAVLLERGAQAVVGILAVLKTG